MKRKVIAGMMAVMMMSMCACATSNQTASESASAESGSETAGVDGSDIKVPEPRKLEGALKIANVTAGMNTFYQGVLNGIMEEIERYGGDEVATVTTYSPQNESTMVEEQINFLETLLQDPDLDVLFFSTHNDSEFIPFFEQFAEKGVSVYLYNMPAQDVSGEAYVSLVSYDFEEAGRLCGEWIAENLADQEVKMLYLEGIEGSHNTIRTEGFMEGIEGADNIEIVVSQCADWTREGGQRVTENALQSNPEINCVYGPYDEMPLGAIVALKDAGKLQDTTVVGYDLTEDGLNAIRSGEMAASVNTDSKQMGNNLIKAAVQHDLEGKEVEKQIFNELVVIDATNEDTIPADNYGYTEREQEYEVER